MWTRLAGLVIKEAIQFLRDRVMLILILWLYTVEVVICTVALSFEVTQMPLAVVDLDHSPASRTLAESFLVTDAFAAAGQDPVQRRQRPSRGVTVGRGNLGAAPGPRIDDIGHDERGRIDEGLGGLVGVPSR